MNAAVLNHPSINNVPATQQRVARIKKDWDLSTLFPEVTGLENSLGRYYSGFAESGPFVPARRVGFLQEKSFMEEFLFFLNSDTEYILSLTGPTGCGKTERVLDFFARINVPVMHMTATKLTKPYQLFGSRQLVGGETKFEPGLVTRGMKNGWPVVIDEGFKLDPKITADLHMIRDRGELTLTETGETFTAKKGFKLILTSNQRGYGDETGFYGSDDAQDIAFLNGISSIECSYPAAGIETAIVQRTLVEANNAFAGDATLQMFAPRMVELANRVRDLWVGNEETVATSDRVEVVISTRSLIRWAKAFVGFNGSTGAVHPLYRGLDYVCLRRACPATRMTVDALVKATFGIDRKDDVNSRNLGA